MKKHLRLVDDTNAVEYAAILEAFAWAIGVLGLLPEERTKLVQTAHLGAVGYKPPAVALETMMRHVIAIADDLQALLGDEDEILEWTRSPNPGLWSGSPIPSMTTPLRVMLDHPDGVRAIRNQLALERDRTTRRGSLPWS